MHWRSTTGTLAVALLMAGCSQTQTGTPAVVSKEALTSCASISINENAYYRIVGRQSNRALDVKEVSTANGAAVQTWGYGGGDNQKWRFQSVGSGFYKITVKHSGKALDVSDVSQNNGAIIHQWDYVGGANQQWCAIPTDSGFYRILAKHSGKAVDVKDLNTADGGVVHQWDYVGGANQQWKFEQVETINQPIWSQEFNEPSGTQPSTAIWNFETGGSGWGNNELQNYTNRASNLAMNGAGQLVITARREAFGSCWYGACQYTSARITTQNKYSVLYGRIEARIKIPGGQGIWPAFWMLGANLGSVGWPNSGEIDIMEVVGSDPNNVHTTLHGPGYSGCCGIHSAYNLGQAVSNGYHVFAVDKRQNDIKFFVDGVQVFRVTPANIPAGTQWVFNQPFFMLLNLAVGGNWPGNPDASTPFPAQMLVDYVRVYP